MVGGGEGRCLFLARLLLQSLGMEDRNVTSQSFSLLHLVVSLEGKILAK